MMNKLERRIVITLLTVVFFACGAIYVNISDKNDLANQSVYLPYVFIAGSLTLFVLNLLETLKDLPKSQELTQETRGSYFLKGMLTASHQAVILFCHFVSLYALLMSFFAFGSGVVTPKFDDAFFKEQIATYWIFPLLSIIPWLL